MQREIFWRLSLAVVLSMFVLMTAGAAMADEPMFWPADRQYVANDGSSPDDRAVLTDHDGDGDLDIIAYYDDGWYKWLENNGDGSYKDPVNLPEDFYLASNNEADLDGDGDLDLVTGQHYQYYNKYFSRVHLNNGDGTYTSADYSAYGDPILLDLDGDGDLDIVTAGHNYSNRQGSIYLNDGSGTFILSATTGFMGGSIAPGDYDNDGDTDLATIERHKTGYYYEDHVALKMNNGNGTFTAGEVIALPKLPDFKYSSRIRDIISADFNADGITDLALYTDNAEVFILTGDGNGGFTLSIENYFGCASGLLTAGDVDNDGDIDLVLVDPDNCGDLGVLKNNGDGTFAGAPRYLMTATRWEVLSVATGDFNGDGLMDMAVGRESLSIQLLINKGGRDYEEGPSYPVNDVPYDIVAADLDGDGDLDLATMGIEVLFNDGTGVFSEAVNYHVDIDGYPSWYSGEKLHVDDVDADGDLDIIHPDAVVVFNDGPDLAGIETTRVNWQYRYFITISMNDGTGSYPDMIKYELDEDVEYITVADVDNDGDIDIGGAVYIRDGTELLIMSNDGAGNFTKQGVYEVVSGGNSDPFGMTAGDFNRDGHIDFAFINCYHVIVIVLNNGDGTFRVGGFYSGVCGSSEVIKTADLDGDGADDIVSIEDYPYSAVHILYNNVKAPLNIRELTEKIISDIDSMKQAELAAMIRSASDNGAVAKGPAQAMLSKALAASGGVDSAGGALGHKGNKAQAMLLTARQQLSGLLKVLTTVENKQ
jgi:hypothetical protein